jgi:hypothetical protein
MGMKNFSCHGYTVKASTLAVMLPEEHRARYTELSEGQDWEEAQKILDEHLPDDIAVPHLFLMYEEFESEDLETGEMYASWDTDELFEMIPLTGLELLRRYNVNPELNRWVAWG